MSSSSDANLAGGGDEAAGDGGGLGMQGGGGRAADGIDLSRTLGRESESRKRKAAVVPAEFHYFMGNEGTGDLDVPSEDCYRISKEIENLRSQLALKKKELKCYQQNKKLRIELDLKVKDVECLRKENEELKTQNMDLQENIVEILDSQIESTKRHLQQTESSRTRLELLNARVEEETKNLHERNSEETCCLMSHPSSSNVLKTTLEDEVLNLKARDEDHLKEIADIRKQLHVRDQEVKDFSERCKSLEIEMVTKNDEIDRLCKDLTAKRQGKALIEKSCAAVLESFNSKKTAAVKTLSDAAEAYHAENVSLEPDDLEGLDSSLQVSRQIAYSSFEQMDAQQSAAETQSVGTHARLCKVYFQFGQTDAQQASENGAFVEELAPTCDRGPATPK